MGVVGHPLTIPLSTACHKRDSTTLLCAVSNYVPSPVRLLAPVGATGRYAQASQSSRHALVAVSTLIDADASFSRCRLCHRY